jgi:hypothetical protein
MFADQAENGAGGEPLLIRITRRMHMIECISNVWCPFRGRAGTRKDALQEVTD